ncbi:MAG: S41 family peptidase [Xanthomonadales bacterium]|nr:S41 family peptidase [Xanthomonadales bacterium]
MVPLTFSARLPLLLALLLPVMASGPLPALAEPVAVSEVADAAASLVADDQDLGPDLDAIRRFVEVYRVLKGAYVEPVEDEALIEAAIGGMLGSLDRYTGYLDLDALEVLTDDTLGAYDGLGVEVISGAGILQVIGAMADSPAERAGLQPGDFITHIDEVEVDEANLAHALRQLRGRPGSRVRLGLLRNEEPLQIDLVRARIRLGTVRGQLLAPGYALIGIEQCQQHTAAELHRQLTRLRRAGGAGLAGAILDLRGNPGGALDAAVAITELFLDRGRIVSIHGRMPGTRRHYDARPGGAWTDLPLAILIDGETASAAEIVASALQSHGRAVLLGERSFGKGSVQNVFVLDEAHAARVTTAHYLAADGRVIQGQGVAPDIAVADVQQGRLQPVAEDEDADPVVAAALAALRRAAAGEVSGDARAEMPEMPDGSLLNHGFEPAPHGR